MPVHTLFYQLSRKTSTLVSPLISLFYTITTLYNVPDTYFITYTASSVLCGISVHAIYSGGSTLGLGGAQAPPNGG